MRKSLPAALAALAAVGALARPPEVPEAVFKRCATCHGEQGESIAEDFPRLAGQHEAYLAKELDDFRAGRREGPMVRMARGLTDAQVAALAKYYASQPVPPPAPKTELHDVGRYLYRKGNPWSGVPACKACHGEAARGTEKLPALAGQHAAYLEREIREFTSRARTNDNEVMHTVSQKLTALEVRALAEYLASLP
ncbi:MAG: cytochrome c4 [Burkholderiales bacterium]|nr:cytochrome c4 [Burkholderiales bacterium]